MNWINWISQNRTWLFDGVAGVVLVAAVGWFIRRVLHSKQESVRGEVAANSTYGNASVTSSPVGSGTDVAQAVNNSTVNVAFHPGQSQAADNSAREAALELLKSEKWPKRSFDIFRARLGGYHDDELRKILVSVGAVRFQGANKEELWGLRERNPEPQPTSESVLTALPSLRFVQAKQVKLTNHLGRWVETDHGESSGIIAVFKNEPGELGQRTVSFRDVTSHLTYEYPQGQEGEALLINFGAWVREYTRYASFRPAQTQSLIVALHHEGKFMALDNPHRIDPVAARDRSGRIVYSPQEREIRSSSGQVEVALVDYRGITVFQGRFAYDLQVDGQMSLRPFPHSASH